MTIEEMHHEWKTRLNKVDSQQERNFRVPEIDMSLNRGLRLFISMVAAPRKKTLLGVETSQRTIDDIRTIVRTDVPVSISSGSIPIPTDYYYFLGGRLLGDKGICKSKELDLNIQQHDDRYRKNVFYGSNFEWREINGVFSESGIKLEIPEGVTITNGFLSYIRKHAYMHFASGSNSGSYKLPNGQTLNGKQDCELPESCHDEIVNLAVLLTSGQISHQSYQAFLNEVKFNNLN